MRVQNRNVKSSLWKDQNQKGKNVKTILLEISPIQKFSSIYFEIFKNFIVSFVIPHQTNFKAVCNNSSKYINK